MGEKPNRLINEKSPYLLQHAFNPVDWFPWSDEAFEKARAEDKPIFLSIGYSTCHWCHVMAHESFENDHIAELLNRWFICIKVDREERPDIDQLYMTATQAMTGGGGWPMSVFLFPDGKPFYAGTYYPPVSQYGKPGFVDVIRSVHDAWSDKRQDLMVFAAQLTDEIKKRGQSGQQSVITKDIHEKGYRYFKDNFDSTNGGFGSAPKFPRPVVYTFLLQYWYREKDRKALEIVLTTLQKMAAGGVYDHIGGGFHRYATDPGWREPHFEKMLYDQSQLAESYLDAFLITGDPAYAEVAEDIFAYVSRDMTDAGGGFYSAEDADSEDPYNPGSHGEGAFYLWTEHEIERLLGKEDAAVFNYLYGVKRSGNAPHDPQGEFTGKNILYRDHTIEETADHFKKSTDEIKLSLNGSRKKLHKIRSGRNKPHLDDKIITSWNGLMIGALAKGGRVIGRPDLLTAAIRAAEFIRKELYRSENSSLIRIYRQGRSNLQGQLDDYAFLVKGLLELYESTQEPQWLIWADALTEKQIELFWDKHNKGFFDSVQDPRVPVRMKGQYDGAEPCGNSIAAANLYTIGSITGNEKYMKTARETVESAGHMLNSYPEALPHMLSVWNRISGKSSQIVIAGVPGREDTQKMQKTVYSFFHPNRTVLLAEAGKNQQFLTSRLPFIETVEMIDEKATVYLCQNFVCQLPINDIDALRQMLKEEAPGDKNRR